MAKPKAPAPSPFEALLGARKDRQPASVDGEPSIHSTVQTSERLAVEPARNRAKSVDPDYVKFTTYIRKTTHKRLKLAALEQGRELSDIVEELVCAWLARPDTEATKASVL